MARATAAAAAAAAVLLALTVLVALVPGRATAACLSVADRAAALDTAKADLDAAGFGVVDARFSFFNIAACNGAPTGCFFQNPTSPYGFLQVPDNPAQTPLPYALPQIGVNVSYRLLPSEAILLVGCTPPTSRYFGFTPYITWRYRTALPVAEQLKWINIFGSLNDAVNQATVKTFPPGSGPFSNNAIIVITTSQTAFEAIAPIVAAAFGTTQVDGVNLLAFPGGNVALGLRFGLDIHDDLFSLLFRQAIAADPVAFAAWAASDPFSALRVYYKTAPANNTLYSFSNTGLRTRATAVNEIALYQTDYDALVADSVARYAGRYNVRVIPWTANLLGFQLADWGGQCLQAGVSCAGDTRDATYLVTNVTQMFTNPTDQYVVYGANHMNNGGASYSNLVFYNYVGQIGLVDVTDMQYTGSANTRTPDFGAPATNTPSSVTRPQFFRWKFARACAPLDTTCSLIPSSGFPSFPAGGFGLIATRAYVASTTNAGPSTTVLLKPTMLALQDRCRPQACDATGGCGGTAGYVLYNIAFASQAVKQSSVVGTFVATNAVNGGTLVYLDPAISRRERQAYWEIDLGFARRIENIVMIGSWTKIYMLLSNSPFSSTVYETAEAEAEQVIPITPASDGDIDVRGTYRYMRLQYKGSGVINFNEIQVNAYCLSA